MRISMFITMSLISICGTVNAELQALESEDLQEIAAQTGITLDVDLSDVGLTYNYTNPQNPNETYWIAGANAGSGADAVKRTPTDTSPPGSGAGLLQVNGITIDVADYPGVSAAVAIGAPSEIRLNRVNTGDYYVAHPGVNANSPPIVNDTIDRKLIGLKWNTPPALDFSAAGQGAAASSVTGRDFSNDIINMSGRVLIFPN